MAKHQKRINKNKLYTIWFSTITKKMASHSDITSYRIPSDVGRQIRWNMENIHVRTNKKIIKKNTDEMNYNHLKYYYQYWLYLIIYIKIISS